LSILPARQLTGLSHSRSRKQELAVQSKEVVPEKVSEAKLVPELQTKHPLQNEWELWYYKNVSPNFEHNLHKITAVGTVEDFWGYVCSSLLCSLASSGSSLSPVSTIISSLPAN